MLALIRRLRDSRPVSLIRRVLGLPRRALRASLRPIVHTTAYLNVEALPWPTAFGLAVILAGGVALVGLLPPTDPLALVLGDWQKVFDAVYLLSGLGLVVGIAAANRLVELAAVKLLSTSLVARFLALAGHFGISRYSVITLSYYAVFVWACRATARSLERGDVTVQLRHDIA